MEEALGAGERVRQRLPTHGTAPAKTGKTHRTTGRENKHTTNELERHLVAKQRRSSSWRRQRGRVGGCSTEVGEMIEMSELIEMSEMGEMSKMRIANGG